MADDNATSRLLARRLAAESSTAQSDGVVGRRVTAPQEPAVSEEEAQSRLRMFLLQEKKPILSNANGLSDAANMAVAASLQPISELVTAFYRKDEGKADAKDKARQETLASIGTHLSASIKAGLTHDGNRPSIILDKIEIAIMNIMDSGRPLPRSTRAYGVQDASTDGQPHQPRSR